MANEESRPALRRYIREVNRDVETVEYETFDDEERKLRFTAAISHAGLVRLLQDVGGNYKFVATEETLDDLFHHEVGIRVKDGTAELILIRKPDGDF